MTREPELGAALRAKMEDYLRKGYARKMTTDELRLPYERIWYLPIFPVFNPNKPGKLRIVWDAAAAVNGVSLNSVLMTGPDQLTELPAVLYKFRQYPVAIGGDVREMFHQLRMNEMDQHCHRFYFSMDENQKEPDVYILLVMSFGATCSPSLAQFVKNENAERFRRRFPTAVDAIIKSHYVDDMYTSVPTKKEAIVLAKQVKEIHSHGGFEMTNWVSNSPDVLEALDASEVPEKNLDTTIEVANEKVLGMWWSTESDVFTYKLFLQRNKDILSGTRRPTKRELLRTMMSVYDPLGLIAHYLMFLKMLLQEVWRSGVGWDDCIAEREWEKWNIWLQFLPSLENLRIPRCYRLKTSINSSVQLHTFVDASENGYAAVCYFRFEEDGRVECTLIGAKSRVAPLKFVSIPRLELQAGIIGARLAKAVEQGHTYKISKRFFWTDARNVLCWLNSDHRRYSQFVAFRVSELLETTDLTEWRWVPTKLNVADEATKWKCAPSLKYDSRWFKGPEFLLQPEENWPKLPALESSKEELRSNFLNHHDVDNWVVTPANFSSWKRLLHTVAFVMRFPRNLRRMKAAETPTAGPLSAEELTDAANYIYRRAQENVYGEERKLLAKPNRANGTPILPKSSSLYKVEPYLDDAGVMRMRGRIGACDLIDESTKHPVILPRKHHITSLIIQKAHEEFLQQCHQTVLNEIRRRYYIPRLRTVYSKTRRDCQKCKIMTAKPQPPPMADLPKARLAAFVRPFSYLGIDYFGPMQVVVGRRVEKRWGVLATCLTTRAIHIELAHSLTTDSCIMCLQNIIARRGTPVEIISDRGTNLIGASKELKEALGKVDKERLMKEFTTENLKWVFNPPASPHMGGSWERLIQSVKKILTSILPTQRLPTHEALRNALVMIENVINSRPLTYVPVDDEAAPALTPNSFLLGSTDGSKPLVLHDDSGVALRSAWKSSQILANKFWKKWLEEYLPEITRRSKWFTAGRQIQIGDIVIVVDPSFPRNCWPKGRIIATKVSKDGQVRSATVQTAAGIYERPAVRLAMLDVGADRSDQDQDPITGGAVATPLV
ncbi:uncharacterized protein LOC129770264 [Toxorhynchites rutilus septentrionalis]|uniref:uncharacterized protein LOC129770264 n=1 Tax=Toxorhynchites rutilus septentrionalis TaxID=329112 RepID=UPI0024789A5A|nr:uncharacterized protein LOC129770264 [Toxorhynchites rutilus septentrionalis]XP_055628951.1 uncharacterized protein LOC129770264 [Toxorhynchites rutilus septentrionalis]XP_055628952.1 uncharacterized protein LOC129770264 [Toxorhynchites rutilus septentrionalis]